jgi:hypothetical protein
MGNTFIDAKSFNVVQPPGADPAILTFTANQPETGKVSSSSKKPRKLMRPWQRQEGQLWGASVGKRAEAITKYQLDLATQLQVQ